MSAPAYSTSRSRAAARSHAWQSRRAELLKEACTDIANRCAAGTKRMRAIRDTARKFRNRSLGNGRQLSLSAKSMQRHFYRWQDKGEAAFALHLIAGRNVDLDPLLLRLILLGAIGRSKTVSEILIETGIGKRDGRASLGTIYRALPAKEINRFLVAERRLRARRKATEQTLQTLNSQLRELRAAAEEKFLTKGSA